MHKRLQQALTLAALLAGSAAQAEGPHQHGVASLELVVDGPVLSITLDSPLDNLLGFERGPRSEAERAAVRAMAQRFHAGAGLVVPAAAAGCQLQAVTLQSDVISPALLAKAAAPGAASTQPAASAGHADLQATLRYQCAQPQALKTVSLAGLFQTFGRLRQLDAAVVAPGVQRGLKLGPKQPNLAW